MKPFPTLAVFAVIAMTTCTACGNADEVDVKAVSAAGSGLCANANTVTYDIDRPSVVDEPHANAGLLELKRLSTVAVSGTVTAVRDGVRYRDDPRLAYAEITIKPTEVLRGDVADEITIALSSDTFNGIHFTILGQPIPAVGACGIWFLQPTRDPASKLLMPVSSGAEILFDSAGKVTNHGEAASLREAETLGSLDKILAVLR
jgi:hypothetical protein